MTERTTPMMEQYFRMKSLHQESILLFRMGDFYEMFFDDAKEAAPVLGLTLTTRGTHRGEPIPMAGVPWHSVDGYIKLLIEAGKRVAICDQVEDPRKARGIVRRAVTEVVTAGTVMAGDDALPAESRYVAAVVPGERHMGLSLADLTTGEFLAGEFTPAALRDELLRHRPAEVLVPAGAVFSLPRELPAVLTTSEDGWRFTRERALAELTRHLGVSDLDGFGCGDLDEAVGAAGGLLHYLRSLKGDALGHLRRLRRLSSADELFLDASSLRHLEVLEAPEGGRSLRQVLDRTVTTMGARFLRHALARPPRRVAEIRARHDAVDQLRQDRELRDALTALLRNTHDLERLAGRLGARRANPRDLVALRRSLDQLPEMRLRLSSRPGRLGEIGLRIDPLDEVRDDLAVALSDEPPLAVADGGAFREGYSAELDAIRLSARDARRWIAALQETERRRSGIANLKVGYNRVFGYYIEVTRANAERVPADYVRKQTLVGAERYVTEELKEKETLILGAEERQIALETSLFEALRDRVAARMGEILDTARALAETDFLRALAEAADAFTYVRPEMHEDLEIRIRGGRHPVVERLLPEGEFIPNDCEIAPDRRQILLITGPNMAGKSTYLRQVGLIVLMAQAGSFVPAESASIGVADRIFTRVGAGDNIGRGQSTFLVEMQESANILHNATSRSLVLLDEVGRGTSTFDGLSIAWAMTEHLHDGMTGRPRTLFATHFHELTQLAERLRRVVNLRVEVKEWGDQVVFLRKIVAGKADRSYGIHVAQMAGIPGSVIDRAREILGQLEREAVNADGVREAPVQTVLPLSRPRPPRSAIEEMVSAADPDRMSPLEALSFLHRLRSELKPDPGRRGS